MYVIVILCMLLLYIYCRCRIKQSTTAISNAREKRFRAQTLDFRASSVFSAISRAFNYARNLPAEIEYNLPCLAFWCPGRSIILSPLIPSRLLRIYLAFSLSSLSIYIYLHHFPWFCLLRILRYCHFLLLPSACTRRVSRDYRQSLDFSIFASRCTKSVVRAKRPGTTKYQNFLDLLLWLEKTLATSWDSPTTKR